MEKSRYELTNYRKFAGLTILQLAEEMGVDEETVRRWEAGIQEPQPPFVKKLCTFFNVDHPAKLNLDAQFNAPAQSQEEIRAMFRRELFEYIKATSIVAGADPSVLLRVTVDDPNELLHACRVVLDDCWDRHAQNRNTLVDSTIKTIMPGLRELAMEKSPHQHEAASLAIEAKIIQMEIAAHKEDYSRRVSLGSDIVLIGQTSGDRNLHAMAIGWHSKSYY
jgi:transcriptional regulator with XRE-family HTH domain